MKRKLLAASAIVAGAWFFHTSIAYATVTVCGPDNGTGCSLTGELMIDLNEAHDQARSPAT